MNLAAGTRILIVCEHASAAFGGEAVLPWHYFRLLREKGIDVHLIAHARTRDELVTALPDEADRMHFISDTSFNRFCWRVGSLIPQQIAYLTVGYASRLGTQLAARRLAKRLVREFGINVVHQPIPVSPREPSLLHGLGVPVVMGPLNGNMSYPPGFARGGRWRILDALVAAGRMATQALHRFMPGKLRARVLLVANARTRKALPRGAQGEIIEIVENGVDLGTWYPASQRIPRKPGETIRFVFTGRLVDWKAVDILLDALARTPDECRLEIVGDGPVRHALQQQADRIGVASRVRFHGWLPQVAAADVLRNCDALVLPSIYECGGAAVLEAMATGLPVIATDWGGPADYLDDTCGILIPPTSRARLEAGLAEAMVRLHGSPALCMQLGSAGRLKVEREFDWRAKVDHVLQVCERVAAHVPAKAAA